MNIVTFLKEVFFALTGRNYSVDEIQKLFSHPSPSDMIFKRKCSAAFINFNNNEKTFEWNTPYDKKWVRRIASKWFISWYIICALTAISPIYFTSESSTSNIFSMVIFSVSFITIAIFCLNRNFDIKQAIAFMKDIE